MSKNKLTEILLHRLLKLITQIVKVWDQWWFTPKQTNVLSFFRLMLCGVLFYMAFMRSFHLDYYTDASWIPRKLHFFVMPESLRPDFTWFFWSDNWGPLFHSILVILLGLATLGLGNRVLLFSAWIIQIAFIQRNYAVVFGADHIGTLLLFLLSFTNCFESWSIKKYFPKFFPQYISNKNSKTDLMGSVGFRLVQIQMCVIYCYTGLEKLKGNSWWDGTALWNVLANPQQTVADFTWIRNFPILIALMTFITVGYEIYWPVAVGSHKTRKPWLILGIMFHIGIGLSMGLMVFSLVMISTYPLFLSSEEYSSYIVSNLDRCKKWVGV